ncbi:MAG: AhpC/TSA family protein [Acidimicrobiia bacterium]
MREAHAQIEALDTSVVVVGTGAAFQAERLMAEGMPFACLVDPDANLYRALGIGRIGFTEWFRPTTIRRYLAAYRRGSRQGRITGDWRRLSGVALIAPDRTVRWAHIATGVGDYPTIDMIREALATSG